MILKDIKSPADLKKLNKNEFIKELSKVTNYK